MLGAHGQLSNGWERKPWSLSAAPQPLCCRRTPRRWEAAKARELRACSLEHLRLSLQVQSTWHHPRAPARQQRAGDPQPPQEQQDWTSWALVPRGKGRDEIRSFLEQPSCQPFHRDGRRARTARKQGQVAPPEAEYCPAVTGDGASGGLEDAPPQGLPGLPAARGAPCTSQR